MASTLLSRRLLLSSSSSSSSSKTDLDKTLSIAFVTVLFAGFFYLVILSIQQCILRRRRQQAHSQHQTAEQANPERSAELCAIPVIIYGSSSGPLVSSGDVDISCSVCLAEYEEGEEMKVLPRCGHMFHRECIDRWLIALSSVCPICRDRAIEHVVGPGETRCNSREVARWNNVGLGLSTHGII